MITTNGSNTSGQSLSLICSVHSLVGNTAAAVQILSWQKDGNDTLGSVEGDALFLTFSPLRTSDASSYKCNLKISFELLAVTFENHEEVILQVQRMSDFVLVLL